eukprot:931031-Rhodomonas_salina.1
MWLTLLVQLSPCPLPGLLGVRGVLGVLGERMIDVVLLSLLFGGEAANETLSATSREWSRGRDCDFASDLGVRGDGCMVSVPLLSMDAGLGDRV